MSDKLGRVLQLYQALLVNGELTNRGICEALGVDRKTAWRDLKALQQAGVALAVEGGGKHRRYLLKQSVDTPGTPVEVRFGDEGLLRAAERGLPLAALEQARRGCATLVLMGDPAAMTRQVLSFGADLEVLAPAWLRRSVLRVLTDAIAAYDPPDTATLAARAD